jgi:hypothetical protein
MSTNKGIVEKNMKRSSVKLLWPSMVVGLLITCGAAKAGPVSLTLASPFQTISNGGGLLTFQATVDNTGSTTEYLNSDSTTLAGPLVLDDSPFFSNFPLFLDPGGTFTGELFTVSVPSGTADGLYPGSFEILGGGPTDFTDVLASANFDVSVAPEPGSFVLLLTGLAAGLGVLLRRRLIR